MSGRNLTVEQAHEVVLDTRAGIEVTEERLREYEPEPRRYFENEGQALDFLRSQQEKPEKPKTAEPPETPVPELSGAVWTDKDLADIAWFNRQDQQFAVQLQTYAAERQRTVAEIAEAEQRGDTGRAQALKTDLAEADKIVATHYQQREALRQTIEYNIAARKVAVARQQLYSRRPQLKDGAERERFIEWLVNAEGHPRELVMDEKNPVILEYAHRAMVAEARLAELASKPKRRVVQMARRDDKDTSVEDSARALHKEGGTVDTALAVLQARRAGR